MGPKGRPDTRPNWSTVCRPQEELELAHSNIRWQWEQKEEACFDVPLKKNGPGNALSSYCKLHGLWCELSPLGTANCYWYLSCLYRLYSAALSLEDLLTPYESLPNIIHIFIKSLRPAISMPVLPLSASLHSACSLRNVASRFVLHDIHRTGHGSEHCSRDARAICVSEDGRVL
jgi:hypothetical protein